MLCGIFYCCLVCCSVTLLTIYVPHCRTVQLGYSAILLFYHVASARRRTYLNAAETIDREEFRTGGIRKATLHMVVSGVTLADVFPPFKIWLDHRASHSIKVHRSDWTKETHTTSANVQFFHTTRAKVVHFRVATQMERYDTIRFSSQSITSTNHSALREQCLIFIGAMTVHSLRYGGL